MESCRLYLSIKIPVLIERSQDTSRQKWHTAVLQVRDLVLSALFLGFMVNLYFSCFFKNWFKKKPEKLQLRDVKFSLLFAV